MRKVMVIDDSETDQFICSCVFSEYDPEINVVQAFDGQEGLELLDDVANIPDIIFLDINMPRMNGHDFLKAYSEQFNNQASVIVMLTSSGQDKDRDMSMQYDFVREYHVKPLTVDSIKDFEDLLRRNLS